MNYSIFHWTWTVPVPSRGEVGTRSVQSALLAFCKSKLSVWNVLQFHNNPPPYASQLCSALSHFRILGSKVCLLSFLLGNHRKYPKQHLIDKIMTMMKQHAGQILMTNWVCLRGTGHCPVDRDRTPRWQSLCFNHCCILTPSFSYTIGCNTP